MGYNVGFTPVVLAGLFVVELAIIWLVKWTVIGRYRTGVYSVWGPMYMRWWFVQTFMSFAYFFMLGPLRCTGMLNCWLRCLGAKIEQRRDAAHRAARSLLVPRDVPVVRGNPPRGGAGIPHG